MVSLDDAGGLRERKKQETRRALRRTAVRLFMERGAAKVTVQDICHEVGISPRTFFNYFDSKDDAVFGVDHLLRHQVVTGLRARPADEPPLRALMNAIVSAVPEVLAGDTAWVERLELLRQQPDLIMKPLRNNRRLEEAVALTLAERSGHSDATLYCRLAAGAGLAAMRAALFTWDPAGGPAGLTAGLEEAFNSLAAGLPDPAGQSATGAAGPPGER
ncbi:TetR family transcriptional regulator [Streptomyces tsukubensis]|uniref:TetR family transcriptional regulator n=1 Tax=Streptomyces tsukubensis TaxID=83656 RepID=A0A1V4AH28_9ACTN|nr:TetR family transcriptional regulator [Streptomyces tsukubensis]